MNIKHLFFTLAMCFGVAQANDSYFEILAPGQLKDPKNIAELTALVEDTRQNAKTIAIVGAGKSMGGQTIAVDENAYQVSLKHLNKMLLLDVENKSVTVQTGMTWRELQKLIAPHGLAVKAMQSYNSFSIGGSLGVNVHGQDFNAGMLIETVQSFRLLLASGAVVNVSRTENAELFGFAIGGYGLAGIIVDVTLELTDDVSITRVNATVPSSQLGQYFVDNVEDNPSVQFYSARYSMGKQNLLKEALVIVYEKTDRALVVQPSVDSKFGNMLMRNLLWLTQQSNVFRSMRSFIEKLYLDLPIVYSRNNLMGSSLEALPQDTKYSQYILQEYFIPYEQLDAFIEKLRGIVTEHKVELLNVSARHVRGNDESVLSWSPNDSCALVLYIGQKRNSDAYENAVNWTRKLIDAAIENKGSFYLPYQYLATRQQVTAVYKNINAFLALKRKYDPQGVFKNKAFTHYLLPQAKL